MHRSGSCSLLLPTVAMLAAIFMRAAYPLDSLAEDESSQPGLGITVEVEGKSYQGEAGKPLNIPGTFKNPSVVVKTAENRVFHFGGLHFEYPAYFAWEAEVASNSSKSWTLSGNSFKIIFFRTSGASSPQEFAETMLKKFLGTSISDASETLGGVALSGKAFRVYPGEIAIDNKVFEVKAPSGTGLLIFQDVPKEPGKQTAEATSTLQLLQRTFKLY